MIKAPGTPPLGTTPDGRGTTFALFSREAEKVELCLFDETGRHEVGRHVLAERTGDVWHDWLPGVAAGQVYGYRVHGPYRPADGLRFNPHKLLIDPYTRALAGRFAWNDAVFGYTVGHPDGDLSFDARDSAAYVPKCVVTGPGRDVRRPPRPATPMARSVIYELHAKGMTQLHPDVPHSQRGTIAGLAQPAVIEHLKRIGVTAVELLPVHAWIDELPLTWRGLVNYWGYNTLAFFCADESHLGSGGMEGFARMVDAFHAAGLEVVLDVVYNHTAEGDATGPTLSFRGLDNRSYYRLEAAARRHYVNVSGCGNTLDASNPTVARLIADSLRYWAEAGGVDGFRFDLASALVRDADGGFASPSELLVMIDEDPVLSRLKLIAEPWDATAEGHRLGAFPGGWSEWNDRYRNTVRRFWAGEGGLTGDLAMRVSGSADVFGAAGRRPSASIDFVTSHDGFSLSDLVYYAGKRNDANGEGNHDGETSNFSFGLGENAARDPATSDLIRRQCLNLLATLLLSRGVPMLRAGDELSHSQGGNNNAYCQDNETSWLDWSALGDESRDLTGFVAALARFRAAHPALTADHFLEYPEWNGDGYRVAWLTPEGREMTPHDWRYPDARFLACMISDSDDMDRVLIVSNALHAPIPFALPASGDGWRPVVDTALRTGLSPAESAPRRGTVTIAPRSLVVFAAGPETAAVIARARARGIATGYHDIQGTWHEATPETLTAIIEALGPVPPTPEPMPLIRRDACHLPAPLDEGRRIWGLTVQLYGLRSDRNWGIGDFADLRTLVTMAAPLGIAAIQVNPLHALFPWWPEHVSPYAPSSRQFVNPLYIAAEDVPEFAECREAKEMVGSPSFKEELKRLRATELVDFSGVARCKMAVLEVLYRHFRDTHLRAGSPRAGAFRAFREAQGQALSDFATFEALGAHFAAEGRGDWREWPAEYRSPRAPAVAEFAAAHEEAVAWRAWLQWIAMEQLGSVGALARKGMVVGLVADIAIGAAATGADTWRGGELVALEAEIGAPPDPFNENGQTWGTPPWRPHVLRAQGYAPFRAMLSAAMFWAGGLRLDHVIGFARQFWVPRGRSGREGAYVTYPLDDLLAVIAEESCRHRCLVIGEDLGTVPEGFRTRMHEAGVLSTKVLYFERKEDGAFRAPADYPYLSSATASTHDLPTIAGFALARDIDARARTDYYATPGDEAAARAARQSDLLSLIEALAEANALREMPLTPDALRDGMHRFLAATGSALVLVQLDDAIGAEDQANLPGTTSEYPNWRRKYPVALETIARDRTLTVLADIFAERRSAPSRGD